jgi:hypothetical protein
MKGKRSKTGDDHICLDREVRVRFKDKDGQVLFTIEVGGRPWYLDKDATFDIDLRNCSVVDLDSGHIIILPVMSL